MQTNFWDRTLNISESTQMTLRLPSRVGLSTLCAVLVLSFAPKPVTAQLLGFTDEGTQAQRDLEARFDSQLDVDHLSEWLRYLTRHPNHVGSPGAKENAEWIADKFRSWLLHTRAMRRIMPVIPKTTRQKTL